jgi:hypothetical protein
VILRDVGVHNLDGQFAGAAQISVDDSPREFL